MPSVGQKLIKPLLWLDSNEKSSLAKFTAQETSNLRPDGLAEISLLILLAIETRF